MFSELQCMFNLTLVCEISLVSDVLLHVMSRMEPYNKNSILVFLSAVVIKLVVNQTSSFSVV